jgi:hypothetical protein
MLSRRTLITGTGAGLVTLLAGSAAYASVVRPLSLAELVQASQHVLVVTALQGHSVWEKVAGRKRIVTYTRLAVEETVALAQPDSEVMVRTLGGNVGDIGQIVHGEAALVVGQRALAFLRRRDDASLGITAMSQGHYPTLPDAKGALRLTASPRLAELFGPKGSAAVTRLVGRTLAEARQLVVEAARR